MRKKILCIEDNRETAAWALCQGLDQDATGGFTGGCA